MIIKKNTNIHVPTLDGLRGLAILLVMGSHFFFNVGVFRLGWIGVDLFFVLSGYLITSMFIRHAFSRRLVGIFYRNRVLRILPLYLAFILFFLIASYLLPASKTELLLASSTKYFWLKHFLFVQNWIYVFGASEALLYTPLAHLWSIAIEEQFYIFFPLIIYIINKIRYKFIFIAAGILLVILFRSLEFYQHGMQVTQQHYQYNTFYRLDTFLAGVLLAYLLRDIRDSKYLNKIFRLLLAASFSMYIFMVVYYNSMLSDNPSIITIGYTVIAIMFMSLIYFTVQQKTKLLEKIFTNRFLVFSGKISYGLYIFHVPFYFIDYTLLHNYFGFLLTWGNEKIVSVIFSSALIGIVYLISYVSYTYFERYFLKMKKTYATVAYAATLV